MSDPTYFKRLKANAAHCRKLAASSSDLEVQQALLEIATDIEMVIPIVEEELRRKSSGRAADDGRIAVPPSP